MKRVRFRKFHSMVGTNQSLAELCFLKKTSLVPKQKANRSKKSQKSISKPIMRVCR